jgi:RNA polymerase sigma factor (sigma-70 family)
MRAAVGSEEIMSEDTSVALQALLDRLRQGDRQAGRQVLERAHGRLRKLAARVLSGSFPALKGAHDLDSVVDESWLRLAQALEKVEPPTVADFFRLAAHKIRQVLLDLADRERRRRCREVIGVEDGSSSSADGLPAEPSGQTHDPARLALWTELHDRAAALPEPQRAVFEMHYYLGLPQAEIARVLGLHPRKVSYLWVAATETLTEHLSGAEGLL